MAARKTTLPLSTLPTFDWLSRFSEHYLQNYLAQGGSKVKVITGDAGKGKTTVLKALQTEAQKQGYSCVFLSAHQLLKRLNDLPNLYQSILEQIDVPLLCQGLCQTIATTLGYPPNRYNGQQALLPLMLEDGLSRNDAIREIRTAVGQMVRQMDITPSFTTWVYNVARDQLITEHPDGLELAARWIKGQVLDRPEKQASGLYEKLSRVNARCWLNSLIHLLRSSGKSGLVVLIDDLDSLSQRIEATKRYCYTPTAAKDTCELFRQMIDDVELMPHFLLVLAGRNSMLNDEKRGFKSYEALWMRLQTGLVPGDQFNPWADILDLNQLSILIRMPL